MSNTRKILIIGSKAFTMSTQDWQIQSFGWDEVQSLPNPYDYHTLVISLLGVRNITVRGNIQWRELKSKLRVKKTWNMLKLNHCIIVIGDPRFEFPLEDGTKIPFLWWTGLAYEWDNLPGTTKYPSDPPVTLERYIQKLDKWDYSLSGVEISNNTRGYTNLYLEEKEVRLEKRVFYQNVSGLGLAFSVYFRIPRRGPQPDDFTAAIVFLPEINAMEEETLGIVLRDVCGVEMMTPEPDWVKQRVAPGQKSIDERIGKRRKAIKRQQKRLEDDQDERIKVRECLKLLYAGDLELEPVVWDILEKLGAKVERPKASDKGDGWISIKVANWNYRGVLEIKSTKSNQFNEDGIGQLAKWKNRGIRLRKEKYKGIFIGNNSRNKPPDQRPSPFADGWRKSANMSEICALTTTDLYRLYELKCYGKFNANNFWSDVFQTNGILNIDKHLSGTIPKGDYSS